MAGKRKNGDNGNNSYIIEYIAVGNSVKITAFDPKTLVEATIVAPKSTSQKEAAELAVRKLTYLLKKRGLI